ncbi:MAG TPA: 4a-hydroxytetrahydrobiopterin dehydratase [Planctomycetota bacterium]|nr:4a-hydroxytetrahydrobiopterin dehydratase [Planctomycetota bacterium]
MPHPLATQQQVAAALATLSGWRSDHGELRVSYRFPTFDAAVAFTLTIAAAAAAADHHPEWTVRYRVVDVATTTHDSGGITALDLDLARTIHALAAKARGEAVAG